MTTIKITNIKSQESMPNGLIKIIYVNKTIYIGLMDADGLFHGNGHYLDEFGNYYTGNFMHGKKHGLCKERAWNTIFEGIYIDNKRNGIGKETYMDKTWTEGNYVHNNRNGLFNFIDTDGNKYTRSYSNGEIILNPNKH